MTANEMKNAVKWAVWLACNIGYNEFDRLLKKMLAGIPLTGEYIESHFGAMRRHPGIWLVNLDDNAQKVFCQYALDKYQGGRA